MERSSFWIAIMTPSQVARSVRIILQDYNFWPTSEGDSPLTVKTRKGIVDSTNVLTLDATMRRKERLDDTPDYKVPTDRTVTVKTIGETFLPLINNAVGEIAEVNDAEAIADLEMPAEKLEFLVQLYNAFSTMANPKVFLVSTPSEPLVGMFLCGEAPIPGATPSTSTIFAQNLIVQT